MYMYVCVSICIYIYAYMHMCLYIYMYICFCICICICIRIRICIAGVILPLEACGNLLVICTMFTYHVSEFTESSQCVPSISSTFAISATHPTG